MTMRRDERRSPPRAPRGGRELLVQIEKPIYGGAFLARAEGKATFVPLTLPGEEARVRVIEEKRSFAQAEPLEIVRAAPERIMPLCPHFGPCGGCHYQHASYEAQLRFKQAILRETLERGGVPAPALLDVASAAPWGYRNRIRVALDGAGQPGYRGRRSHGVVAIRECPIAAPLLVRAAQASAAVLKSAPDLRAQEIALFCDADERTLAVSITAERPSKLSFETVAQRIAEQIPELIGCELTIGSGDGRGSSTGGRWGSDALAYEAAGTSYRVPHGAFFQVNRWLTDALVQRVTGGRKGRLAWDLFAGVGLFARPLAASFERVVAVEAAPAAVDGLESNLAGTAGSAVRAATQEFLERAPAERPDLIVADPPRTGLGVVTAARLATAAADEIVYVSCDPATLARDLRVLVHAGYTVASVTLVDLFPQTFHLETVVELRRG